MTRAPKPAALRDGIADVITEPDAAEAVEVVEAAEAKPGLSTKPLPVNAAGHVLAFDDLPLLPHPRAEALAAQGIATDPSGLTPDGLIAHYAAIQAAAASRE